MKINAYGLEWHASGQSDAFHDLLIEPLQPYTNIQLNPLSELKSSTRTSDPIIFCQVLPSFEILKTLDTKLIWIPMWDNVRNLSSDWWRKLPPDMRIVAFSRAVANKSRYEGFKTLELSFYKNPEQFQPVSWDHGNTLLYWNRRGLVDQRILVKLCKTLRVDTLLFRNHPDPDFAPANSYNMPQKIGSTIVTSVSGSMSRDDYWRWAAPANIFIAPRLYEGVGMAFLEALARGSTIISHNAPTMNEYIVHGQSGILLQQQSPYNRLIKKIRSRLIKYNVIPKSFFLPELSMKQNWKEMASFDLQALSAKSLQDNITGYAQWQQQLPLYADFILNW